MKKRNALGGLALTLASSSCEYLHEQTKGEFGGLAILSLIFGILLILCSLVCFIYISISAIRALKNNSLVDSQRRKRGITTLILSTVLIVILYVGLNFGGIVILPVNVRLFYEDYVYLSYAIFTVLVASPSVVSAMLLLSRKED